MMTTKNLMISALFAVTACTTDAAAPELVLDVNTKDHVAGTLVRGDTVIAFEMMRVPGRQELTLQTIDDQPLITIVIEKAQFQQASILGNHFEQVPACLPNCIIDPVFERNPTLQHLESLPEAQLLHDVGPALEAVGVDPSLVAPLSTMGY